jgi:hypothetical protein
VAMLQPRERLFAPIDNGRYAQPDDDQREQPHFCEPSHRRLFQTTALSSRSGKRILMVHSFGILQQS